MIKKYYLKDYSNISNFISIENFNEEYDILVLALNKIQKKIDDNQINVILSDNLYEKDKKTIFKYYNSVLYTQGIVGVFKTNIIYNNIDINVWVSITSRFDLDDNKPYFLAKMFEIYDPTISNVFVNTSDDELFDFLIVYLFNTIFLNAIQIGYYKEYITHNEFSNKIKGKIDFSEYIKKTGLLSSNLPIVYRERSLDNRLNRLVYSAYLRLKNKFPKLVEMIIDSSETKKYLDYVKEKTSEKTFNKILNESLKPITHPLLINYENLRIISLQILNDDKMSFFDNSVDVTQAALFYIPDLWEKYLEVAFLNNLLSDNMKIYSQNRLRVVESLTIRPDFVIYKDEIPYFVLDAKFKPAWSEGKFNLEDYTKSIRDMNAFNCNKTGVVFPTLSNEDFPIKTNFISDFNQRDNFFRIGISIPDTELKSYEEFSFEMDTNLESSIRVFNNYLI